MHDEPIIPKAHSVRIYYCDSCDHPHLMLLDERDYPIAHFVFDVDTIHLMQSALYRIRAGGI
jgi:hypothetical protein